MSRKILYHSKWITIVERTAKVRGKTITFADNIRPDVAVVVPVFEDGSILMEKQFRHSLDRYIYELPAGHLEKGENPALAAARELEEETGYRPGRIKLMYRDYQDPGSSKRIFYYYHASMLKKGKTLLDHSEIIQSVKMSPSRLERMLKSKAIKDHKTVEGYLYYKNFVAKK